MKVYAVQRGTALLDIYGTQEAAEEFATKCNKVAPRGKQAGVTSVTLRDLPQHEVRPDRITDGMVEAFTRAAKDEPYGLDAIRAGLVAALTRHELEQRTEPE